MNTNTKLVIKNECTGEKWTGQVYIYIYLFFIYKQTAGNGNVIEAYEGESAANMNT